MGFMNTKIIFLVLFIASSITAQNTNIIPFLKKVEAGEIESVKKDLLSLKQDNAADPNVIFLEGVITEDGDKSHQLYEAVYTNFPDSKFADAALFRDFSYYYALGLYKKAEDLKIQLQREYPNSPYLKNTDKRFPEADEMLVVDSSPYKLTTDNEYKFTIQVGAFGQYENAENLQNKLKLDRIKAKISPKRINNVLLYIVTVEKFKNRADAEYSLAPLLRDYSLKGRIVKID